MPVNANGPPANIRATVARLAAYTELIPLLPHPPKFEYGARCSGDRVPYSSPGARRRYSFEGRPSFCCRRVVPVLPNYGFPALLCLTIEHCVKDL